MSLADFMFDYTRHAEQMLAERKIAREWVGQTVLDSDDVEFDPSGDGLVIR